MKSQRIGMLGAGNMAGALIRGLLASKSVTAEQIVASDVRAEHLKELETKYGIKTFSDNRELAAVSNLVVLDESLIDAVTGLSGSGPAYIMVIIEALADGGVKVGLHRDTALLLAAQTVYGSAKLLLETGEHPGRLKDMVTSPGGTAIAGLHTLEAGGIRRTLIDAVECAAKRAAELGEAMAKKLDRS